jgi:hypothetical protein
LDSPVLNEQKRLNNKLWVDFLNNKLKYINVLSLMNGRHIIVSHFFSCSKSSKRFLTSYILFILITCGNIELNPGFTPCLKPTNEPLFLTNVLLKFKNLRKA